jgi:hypothetical protein|tara:strand:+ start:121 stop:471 length:351 start_codon:yes stop_codon:yes gene_type:complete
MAIHEITIQWQGEDAVVEFEDTLTFGEVENLLGGAVDLSDVTKPKIDLKYYRMNLLTKVIKKAPFKVGDKVTLELMDSKIVKKILDEVLEYHPLADYIEDWMETFQSLGKMNEKSS